MARGLLQAAVRSFSSGDYAEATVQLERAMQEDASLGQDLSAIRLRVFLALAHHRPDHADRLLRSASGLERDPVLLYQLALNRLRFREYREGAALMSKLTAGMSWPDVERSLREMPDGGLGDAAILPALPFRCAESNADREIGKALRSLTIEDALSDPAMAPRVWNLKVQPIHLAFAYLVSGAFGSDNPRPLANPSTIDDAKLKKPGNELVRVLILRDLPSLQACMGELPERSFRDREDLRFFSVLFLRYDETPAAALSIAFRFLALNDVTSALEALHLLRVALARLPKLRAVKSGVLTAAEREALDLRIMILRQMQRAYTRPGRTSEAGITEKITGVLEEYLALDREFPRRALRDVAGENLQHREALQVLLDLAVDENEERILRSRLKDYDLERGQEEGQSFFRSVYLYE